MAGRLGRWAVLGVSLLASAALSGCGLGLGASPHAVRVQASPASSQALPPTVSPFVRDVPFAIALPSSLPAGLTHEPSATVIGTKKSPLVTHALILTYAPAKSGGPSLEISESAINQAPSGTGLLHVHVGGHAAEVRTLPGHGSLPPLALWVRANGVSFTLVSQNLSRPALLRVAASLVN